MIAKLKKAIAINGLINVTMALGYKSTSTLQKWIRKNSIPDVAKIKVQEYLKGMSK